MKYLLFSFPFFPMQFNFCMRKLFHLMQQKQLWKAFLAGLMIGYCDSSVVNLHSRNLYDICGIFCYIGIQKISLVMLLSLRPNQMLAHMSSSGSWVYEVFLVLSCQLGWPEFSSATRTSTIEDQTVLGIYCLHHKSWGL